jgi:hypothetical protein
VRDQGEKRGEEEREDEEVSIIFLNPNGLMNNQGESIDAIRDLTKTRQGNVICVAESQCKGSDRDDIGLRMNGWEIWETRRKWRNKKSTRAGGGVMIMVDEEHFDSERVGKRMDVDHLIWVKIKRKGGGTHVCGSGTLSTRTKMGS